MNAETYADEVASLADSFRYELCEMCGGDLSDHTIGPDPLGHAHLWCPAPVGTCPACGLDVYGHETDGPVWTCPADLSTTNPYWMPADERITEELRESSGVFSNCGDDYGFPCYEQMPLHSACYDRGGY